MTVADRAALPMDRRPPGGGRTVLRGLLSTGEGRAGVALACALGAVIAFGQLVAPYEPTANATGTSLSPPSGAHLLGTDELGRDVFSRLLAGGDSVLLVPFLAVTLAEIVGVSIGVFSAYRGGLLDSVAARALDVLMTLPPLLMILAIIAGLGTSDAVVVLAIAFFFMPRIARVARGSAQAVIANDYVAAAESRGERTATIVFREVLPNAAGPIIVDYALRMTYGIVFVTTLSFLGLGAQPPSPDWGLMVSESRSALSVSPIIVAAPAVMIAALAVSFTLIADGLSHHLTGARRGKVTL